MYHSEEEFLKNYDSSKYEKISLTTDILLFSVSDISQDNFVKIEKSINNDGNLNISIVADKNLCIFNKNFVIGIDYLQCNW